MAALRVLVGVKRVIDFAVKVRADGRRRTGGRGGGAARCRPGVAERLGASERGTGRA